MGGNINTRLVTDGSILNGALSQEDAALFDFTMCNPPFFKEVADHKKHPTKAGGEATDGELATAGGELAFLEGMLKDSLALRSRITWYTSMIGRKEDVRAFKTRLFECQQQAAANAFLGTSLLVSLLVLSSNSLCAPSLTLLLRLLLLQANPPAVTQGWSLTFGSRSWFRANSCAGLQRGRFPVLQGKDDSVRREGNRECTARPTLCRPLRLETTR